MTSPAAWRASRPDDDAFTKMPTALVTLTPQFLEALNKVAPKKRRSRARWVIAFALLAIVAVLGFDRSAREFAVTKGRPVVARIAARLHRAPAAPAVQAAAPAAVAAAPAAPAAASADESSGVAAALAAAPAPATEPAPAPVVAPVVVAPVVIRDDAPAATSSSSTESSTSSSESAPAKSTKKPAAKKGQRRASGAPKTSHMVVAKISGASKRS